MKDMTLDAGPVEWLGVTYRTVLRPEDSGGAMSVADSVSPPESGPPRHVHHDADETFVLLTGEADFLLDGRVVRRVAGESVFIPRGRERTFRVTAAGPCRHLVILTPGGFEGFFEAMAAGRCRIPEDMAEIEAIARRFHMTFTGPPLGA